MVKLSEIDFTDERSDYDSENERDMECRMYSQLYFEPNPDYVPLPSSDPNDITINLIMDALPVHRVSLCSSLMGHPQNSLKHQSTIHLHSAVLTAAPSCMPSSPVAEQTEILSSTVEQILMTADAKQIEMPIIPTCHAPNIEGKKESCISIITSHAEPKQVHITPAIKQIKISSTAAVSLEKNGVAASEPVSATKHKNTLKVKRLQRKRLTSGSSVHSIPGSVELDSLYCLPLSPVPEQLAKIGEENSHNQCMQLVGEKIDAWNCSAVNDFDMCVEKEKTRRKKRNSDEMTGIYNETSERKQKKKNKKAEMFSNVSAIDADTSLTSKQFVEPQCTAEEERVSAKTTTNLINMFKNRLKNNVTKASSKKKTQIKKSKLIKNVNDIKEYIMDMSGDSDISVDEEDNLITNLSVNHSNLDGSLSLSLVETDHHLITKKKQSKRMPRKLLLSLDYTEGKDMSNRIPTVPHWTPHMTAFYDSDVSDNYDLGKVHKQMPSSVVEWDLDEDDLPWRRRQQGGGSPWGGGRYFLERKKRCTRCRQFGHLVWECTQLDYCYMCGDTSHATRRECPRNCCFRCGGSYHEFCQKTTAWVACKLCHRKGHVRANCPDVWRRYCYTTSGNVPIPPPAGLPTSLPDHKLSCYSCGRHGHLGHSCKYRVAGYVVLPFDVVSFESPTERVLGKTLLVNAVQGHVDDPLTHHQYGERVSLHTPSRAMIALEATESGLVIGRGGAVIKTLQEVSGCELSVKNTSKGQKELWIYGENIDGVVRAVLLLLGIPVDPKNLLPFMKALHQSTGIYRYLSMVRKAERQLLKTQTEKPTQERKMQGELQEEREVQEKKDKSQKRAANGDQSDEKERKKLKVVATENQVKQQQNKNANVCKKMRQTEVEFIDLTSESEAVTFKNVEKSEVNNVKTTPKGNKDNLKINKSVNMNTSVKKISNGDVKSTPKGNYNKRTQNTSELKTLKRDQFAKKVGSLGENDEDLADSKYSLLGKNVSKINNLSHFGTSRNNYLTISHPEVSSDSDSDCSTTSTDSSDMDSATEDYVQNALMNRHSDSDDVDDDSDTDESVTSDCSTISIEDCSESLNDDSFDDLDYSSDSEISLDRNLDALLMKELKEQDELRLGLNENSYSSLCEDLVEDELNIILPSNRVELVKLVEKKLDGLIRLRFNLAKELPFIKKDVVALSHKRLNADRCEVLKARFKKLATFVLGRLQLGYGEYLINGLHKYLRLLRRDDGDVATEAIRNGVREVFDELFNANLDNAGDILRCAATHVRDESKMEKQQYAEVFFGQHAIAGRNVRRDKVGKSLMSAEDLEAASRRSKLNQRKKQKMYVNFDKYENPRNQNWLKKPKYQNISESGEHIRKFNQLDLREKISKRQVNLTARSKRKIKLQIGNSTGRHKSPDNSRRNYGSSSRPKSTHRSPNSRTPQKRANSKSPGRRADGKSPHANRRSRSKSPKLVNKKMKGKKSPRGKVKTDRYFS